MSVVGIVYKNENNKESCHIGSVLCRSGEPANRTEDGDINEIINFGSEFPLEIGKKLVFGSRHICPEHNIVLDFVDEDEKCNYYECAKGDYKTVMKKEFDH